MKMTMLAFPPWDRCPRPRSRRRLPLPAPRTIGTMGGQGQIVLAADLPLMNSNPLFAVVHESNSAVNGGCSTSSTIYAIAPSAHFFVAPNVSVGGLIGIAHGTNDQNSNDATTLESHSSGRLQRTFHGEPVAQGPWASGTRADKRQRRWQRRHALGRPPDPIEVPILWHPAPHFFIGAGPTLTTELSSSASSMGTSQDSPRRPTSA